uniref:THAP domaincontaining protein 9like [Acyrthosiphon pisum] n=1 Tax=Lepeophtheirus salmonis TaxID=72036 RepID=A0A0K2T8Q9_LEPSM
MRGNCLSQDKTTFLSSQGNKGRCQINMDSNHMEFIRKHGLIDDRP